MDDVRAALARENHRLSAECEATARLHREQRDHLVRQLREADPKTWTLNALARAVGCSKELIANILKAPPRLTRHGWAVEDREEAEGGTVLQSVASGRRSRREVLRTGLAQSSLG